MSGLVDQLQADALDPTISVSTLLRKVKVAAVRLGQDEALAWVDSELGGYNGGDVPDYRKTQASVLALDPYRGWLPAAFSDEESSDLIGACEIRERIASIEKILASDATDPRLEMPVGLVNILNEMTGWNLPRYAHAVKVGVLVAIVEQVRDLVLNWALELTRAGVTGDGLSFTSEERDRVNKAQISIGTFHGSFSTGDASGANSRINQGNVDNSANNAVDHSVFDSITAAVSDGVKDADARQELIAATEAMRSAAGGNGFVQAYQHFIGVAADHFTLLSPYLPALTALLTAHS